MRRNTSIRSTRRTRNQEGGLNTVEKWLFACLAVTLLLSFAIWISNTASDGKGKAEQAVEKVSEAVGGGYDLKYSEYDGRKITGTGVKNLYNDIVEEAKRSSGVPQVGFKIKTGAGTEVTYATRGTTTITDWQYTTTSNEFVNPDGWFKCTVTYDASGLVSLISCEQVS